MVLPLQQKGNLIFVDILLIRSSVSIGMFPSIRISFNCMIERAGQTFVLLRRGFLNTDSEPSVILSKTIDRELLAKAVATIVRPRRTINPELNRRADEAYEEKKVERQYSYSVNCLLQEIEKHLSPVIATTIKDNFSNQNALEFQRLPLLPDEAAQEIHCVIHMRFPDEVLAHLPEKVLQDLIIANEEFVKNASMHEGLKASILHAISLY